MRILLVAYDFPPTPSPQALRWAYLVRELAWAGHEVHVLAPDVNGYGAGQLPELPPSVVLHRSSAGPVTGLLVARQRANSQRFEPASASDGGTTMADVDTQPHAARLAPALNWKGRAFKRMSAFLSWNLYPDLRAEWRLPARRVLSRLLREMRPDVVITSHEPPVSIPLGLYARRKGFKWVADLGDPVLAPYTPDRWRDKAMRLERALCDKADLVTVTSDSALATLQQRHGLSRDKVMVLTQGYDHRFAAAATGVPFDPNLLELVYTGSFYSFRRPEVLLDAVSGMPGVRLTVATSKPPQILVDYARSNPRAIRLLGFVGHGDALRIQRNADLLVNIANADPVQVPGKVYEYLGAPAPILHIGDDPNDAAAVMLNALGAGWAVRAERGEVARLLGHLLDVKRHSGKPIRSAGARALVESKYSWSSLAANLAAACQRLAMEAR